MAKRKLALSGAINLGNGVQQTNVEINYIYVNDDSLTIYTKQGNVIELPMNAARQLFIDKIEDALKSKLETP